MNVSKFAGFLSKYAGEALALAGALRTILPALPIGAADRRKVEGVIERFEGIEASVTKSIKELLKAPAAVVKKTDVENAVRAALPAIVKEQLDALFDQTALDDAARRAVGEVLKARDADADAAAPGQGESG